MLTKEQLERLIAARQEESVVLFANEKFDGAVYLIGYAVELALKRIILLNGFPETDQEFKVYADSKTHNLEVLLKLAGKDELREDDAFSPDWDTVRKYWTSECRYRKIGMVTSEAAKMTMDAVSRIIERLNA